MSHSSAILTVLAHGHKALYTISHHFQPLSKQCHTYWLLMYTPILFVIIDRDYCSLLILSPLVCVVYYIAPFSSVSPWPAYFTSWWISLVPATSSYTQQTKLLVKSTFVLSSRGPAVCFGGAGPCAMEWPKPAMVTSISFVPFIWMALFHEGPNSKGNSNPGRFKG